MEELEPTNNEMPEAKVMEAFDIVWRELSDVLGSAVAAAILRKAARSSIDKCSIFAHIDISIDGRNYKLREPLPDASCMACTDLAPFIETVVQMLRSVTGTVVVDRLLSHPLIRQINRREE